MRSYGQYCSVARALDVIGDRWTLLIVRELLLRGGCRYTDLRNGLPGIATNLLADRLRDLEQAGIVYREEAPPPVATTLFHLTPRGEELRPVVEEIGRWGVPFMIDGPEDDAFRSHWLSLPVDLFLRDHAPEHPPITIEVRAGAEPLLIETLDGEVRIRPGSDKHPDAVLEAPPQLILGLMTGHLDLAEARKRGAKYEGDPRTLQRVLPQPGTDAAGQRTDGIQTAGG